MAPRGKSVRLASAVPALLAAVLLLGVLLSAVDRSMDLNEGTLSYALDDAYIHLTIAKNLAEHGVWGVTPFEFASASSSPLYTLLLAGMILTLGTSVWYPLILNIVGAVALLVLVAYLLRRAGYGPKTAAALALGVLLIMPVEALVLGGMEHVLHALALLGFMWVGASVLARDGAADRTWMSGLLVTAACAVGLRYESLAVVIAFVLLALLKRRWTQASATAIAAAAPVVVFGLISLAKGGFFLPNSLLMKMQPVSAPSVLAGLAKGEIEFRTTLLFRVLAPRFLVTAERQLGGGHLLPASFLGVVVLAAHRLSLAKAWRREVLMLVMAILGLFAHFQFGAFGWFYRYEAYLVSALFVPLLMAARPGLEKSFRPLPDETADARWIRFGVASLLVAIAVLPPVDRALQAHEEVALATNNIYSQQVQMARFLERYYQGRGVVANDIGAICYFSDLRLLDLAGLGSAEVTAVRRGGRPIPSAQFVRNFAAGRSAEVAIVYEQWFPESRPPEWTKVGDWSIDSNVVCGGNVVSFFDTTGEPDKARLLARRLREFSSQLPSSAHAVLNEDLLK